LFLSLTTALEPHGILSDDLLPQHGDDHIQALNSQWGLKDMGVEAYSGQPPDVIRAQLGWVNGRDAPTFQPFRHPDLARNKTTAWSHPAEFAVLDSLPDPSISEFVPQRAKWVQLAGIASAIKLLFTSSTGLAPRGILIADEVGVGKTLHALGIIAFINQIVQGRAANIHDPPILSSVHLSCLIFSLPLTLFL
jgi:hypothetical protein